MAESWCEDVCLFPCEDLELVEMVEGEELQGHRVQIGPHELRLYLAKSFADDLDPNDLGLRLWPGTHVMCHLLLHMDRLGSVLDLGCGSVCQDS